MRLIILATVLQTLNGIKNIFECPFGEEEWKKRKNIFNCKQADGLTYHCLLDLSDHPIEACMKRREYNRDGCPWVFRTDEDFFLGEPLTQCQNDRYCPRKGERFYSNELYVYPACLVKKEERLNFTLPDIFYNNKSSSTTDSPLEVPQSYTMVYTGLSLTVLGFLSIVVLILLWKVLRKKGMRRENEYQSRNSECISIDRELVIYYSGDLDELSPISMRIENEYQSRNSECTSIDRDSVIYCSDDSDELSPISDGTDEDINVKEALLPGQNLGEQPRFHSLSAVDEFGSSLIKKCRQCANKGAEETLKELLKDELDKLNQGCDPRITAEDLKKIICLWVKMHDKPDLMTTAIELLSALGDYCCLNNLEVRPDSYQIPISMLIYSGRMQKEKTIVYLLQRLRHIDDEDKVGNTILHYCVLMNSKTLAEKVIEKDISLLDKCNIDGRSAFNLAIILRRPKIAEFLLENGADIRDENYRTNTVLEACLSHEWPDLLTKILFCLKRKEVKPSDLGKTFRTILSSCKKANLYLIDVALEVFPDMLSSVDYYFGDHPFIWALKVKRKEASQFILERMSNNELYSAEECSGYSALHVSIKSRSLVRKVLKKDKNNMILNKTDRQNNTPIMYAAQCKSQIYFSVLLEQPGLSFLNININGKNILHLVVENNWYGKCEGILRGRDSKGNKRISEGNKTTLLKGQDKYGMTPLMYAVSNFHDIELIQLLVDEGSELEQMDKGRKTVFHHLVYIYSEKIVATWTTCARVLMRSEKYRDMTSYLFKVKDSSGQSLSEIALKKGCLHLLKTVDAEVSE